MFGCAADDVHVFGIGVHVKVLNGGGCRYCLFGTGWCVFILWDRFVYVFVHVRSCSGLICVGMGCILRCCWVSHVDDILGSDARVFKLSVVGM